MIVIHPKAPEPFLEGDRAIDAETAERLYMSGGAVDAQLVALAERGSMSRDDGGDSDSMYRLGLQYLKFGEFT